MPQTYPECVAQLFLHSAINNKTFDEYLYKELLREKLNNLNVDFDEQMSIYNETISSEYKNFTLLSTLTAKIPDENKYGIYCHCLHLGIVRVLDNPIDEFFLLLRVALKVSMDEEARLKKIFSEMFLTFIFDIE